MIFIILKQVHTKNYLSNDLIMKYPTLLFLFFLCSFSVFAQFPNILWEYQLGAPAFGSASAADLDDDGFLEIVFTTYTNDGKVHCLNAENGSVKWTFDIGGCGDVAPLIYDVNNDGQLEVIVNGSCNPTMFCIKGDTGDLIWSQPSGGGDSPPTVADMDQDNLPEILFGNFQGQIRILNGEDGSLDKIINANPNANAVQTEPTLVDINNDGVPEILGANFFNDNGLFVWAFDYESGEPIWVNEKSVPDADFHAYHGGAVADIDNDGMPEYVIGSGAGFINAINLEDGSDLWIKTLNASLMGAVTIADLDGDNELEVIFNNNDYITFDERIWVLNGVDGSTEWSYPITFNSFRGMSVSDLNGNGQLDLVSGHFMGRLRAVEPYSGLIWEINLMDEFDQAGQFPWFETDHQPLIADFDQNGTMDVFAVAGYGTYVPDSLNTGKAFMIEAGVGDCPEWLMFRHDVRRTGYISKEEVDDACEMSTALDEVVENYSVELFPNPNFGSFQLSIATAETIEVNVDLFDNLGIHLKNFTNGLVISENQRLSLDCPDNLPKGVYFVSIEINHSKHLIQPIQIY